MAGAAGIEPAQTVLETAVLPLYETPTSLTPRIRSVASQTGTASFASLNTLRGAKFTPSVRWALRDTRLDRDIATYPKLLRDI